MAATHVLMRHPELGQTAEMAAGSEDVWRTRGWLLADEPDPVSTEVAANTDVPPPADETPDTRPAARKRATDSQEN